MVESRELIVYSADQTYTRKFCLCRRHRYNKKKTSQVTMMGNERMAVRDTGALRSRFPGIQPRTLISVKDHILNGSRITHISSMKRKHAGGNEHW
jgi:hypothetical protein